MVIAAYTIGESGFLAGDQSDAPRGKTVLLGHGQCHGFLVDGGAVEMLQRNRTSVVIRLAEKSPRKLLSMFGIILEADSLLIQIALHTQ